MLLGLCIHCKMADVVNESKYDDEEGFQNTKERGRWRKDDDHRNRYEEEMKKVTVRFGDER